MVIKECFIKNELEFSLANVYALCDNGGRQLLWTRLCVPTIGDSDIAWCVIGHFNVVRTTEGIRSWISSDCIEDYFHINNLIEANFLIEVVW